MVNAAPTTFAEKMRRLVRQRAEQRPLPDGHMRCPLNPAHHVPVATIVRHLEKAHQEDALDLAPNAMYGSETYTRRRQFIETQLRRRVGDKQSEQGDARCCHDDAADDHHYDHNRRRRRRHSRRSSYSSSSSSFSSESSLPRVKRRRSRGRHYEEKNGEKQNMLCPNNDASLFVHDGVVTPECPPPPPAVVPWPGSFLPAETPRDAPTATLFGRYTLGRSIERQSLVNYLLQFGSLRRFDTQPQYATFTLEFDTAGAASRCLSASSPFVFIDGVRVELHCATAAAGVAGASPLVFDVPRVLSAHVPPPPVAPPPPPLPPTGHLQPTGQLQSTGHFQPAGQLQRPAPHAASLISIGGMPVGIAMLSDTSSGYSAAATTTTTTNSANGFIATAANMQIKTPQCVLLAALKKIKKEEIDERRMFEEFARFGAVVNIMVVGPRVVVEFASHESVQKATRALQEEEERFAFCVCLNEQGGKRK